MVTVPMAHSASGRARHPGRKKRRSLLIGLAFISPWIIGFALFTAGPILASAYYSLTEFTIFQAPHWAGLANYRVLLTHDPDFFLSLSNTVLFALMAIPTSIVAAMVMALAMNVKLRGVTIYRSVYFLPSIVPAVASAVLWVWILNPQWGLLNLALRFLSIHGPGWLTSPDWAKPSLALIAVWATGSDMLIYLAALQDIPQSLYEAASIDGASAAQKTRLITLPLLTPIVFFQLINGVIWAFQYFTEAFIMTGGGPAKATLFYALYLYQNAFVSLKMGLASAQAWMLFLIVMFATLAILRSSRGWVYYEGQR
jgi:multiple sugar transport system permease protein